MDHPSTALTSCAVFAAAMAVGLQILASSSADQRHLPGAPGGDVAFGACAIHSDCADAHVCTFDSCENGVCVHVAVSTLCPTDALACNGDEYCDLALGCASRGNPCAPRACTEGIGCAPCTQHAECDDGVPCTEDSCVAGDCQHLPNDALCPDDDLFCTGPPSCADGCNMIDNVCHPLACDETTDACFPCFADEQCFLDECILFHCHEGTCLVVPQESCLLSAMTLATCDDANVCTCDICGVDDACANCGHAAVNYGNVDCVGPPQPNLDDILCVLNGFAAPLSCPHADIAPGCEQGDNLINLDDILAVLAAFAGADPCACNP